MIKLNDISKSFGSNEILKHVSLELNRGNVYGFVGENGAGKTTLFRCVAGLESCNGKIDSDCKPLKNHLGFLFPEPFIFSKITGREYLQLLCNARDKKQLDFDAKNIFDLPLQQYASTYSTGMKKKLAITAILLQENDYFILDEPFNGLDLQSNMVLTEIILKLKALDKVVLVSSHIFSTLSEICDEIHYLQKGQAIKSFVQTDFQLLEQEMKDFTIGNRIENLGLI